MYYTIYRITNIINNKIYIGKHQTSTLNDNYFGSGKLINAAIKKYGLESFKKEILYIFTTEDEMNEKEKEIVTEEFCKREDTYNLCVGGKGGFSYINREKINNQKNNKSAIYEKVRQKLLGRSNRSGVERLKLLHSTGKIKYNTFTGRKHSEETKRKMSESSKGKVCGPKNGNYGTCWITNEKDNKKIKLTDLIPEGWRKGRVNVHQKI